MSKYKISWLNHHDILDWKKVAEEKQYFYCTYLGKSKWEVYDFNDLGYLKLKIGYSLFGPPLNLLQEDIETAYRAPKCKTKIDRIMSTIQKHNNNNKILYVSFIYLIAIIDNKYTEFPVIRVLQKILNEDVWYFIDTLGNIYQSWEIFLDTNVMPKCIYCYPRNGFYTWNEAGQVELDYNYSPHRNSTGNSYLTEDISSSEGDSSFLNKYLIGNEVTLLNAIKGLIKAIVAGPVVRGVTEMAKDCWIKVASIENCSSVYAIHSTSLVAASLHELGQLSPFLVRALEKGPIQPIWFSVLNIMPEILKHAEYEITYTHITQLFVSILFFFHTVVSYDICKHILQETLDDISNNTKKYFVHRPMHSLRDLKDKIVKKSFVEIKRLNDEAQLLEEIIEKNKSFYEKDNFSIKNLLELLAINNNNNSLMHKIASYCFFLEEMVRHCRDCCEKIKQDKMYTYHIDKLSGVATSIHEHETLQSLKKANCLVKQGTTEKFLEHVDDVLEGLLQMVREKKVNSLRSPQIDADSTVQDADN